jgi:hypothetical protein
MKKAPVPVASMAAPQIALSIAALLIALSIAALLTVVLFAESRAWPWSKKKEIAPLYEFPSGWKIMKLVPADETRRVNGFEAMYSKCSPCIELAFEHGNFVLYREMREVNYENWWTVVVYIPPDHFLNIPQSAKITMVAVSKQDSTIYIDSERIVFCKGWVIGGLEKAIQHTMFDNSKGNIQIKPFQDIGREDFEFTDLGIEGGTKYTVGYVYFGKHQKIKKVVNFLIEGIDAYPVNATRR